MKRAEAVTAYVLIKTEVGKSDIIASELLKLPKISNVTVVAGEYDIVVELQEANIKGVFDRVIREIQEIPDIKETRTLLGTKMTARAPKSRL